MRDHDGQQLAYVHFDNPRAAAKPLTRDEALPTAVVRRRIGRLLGVSLALREMTDRGWAGDVCYIRADGTAGQTVEHHLASRNFAYVVIGAGVRLPSQSLAVVEAVVNAVHKAAPAAVIAFNTRPEDSADAAARWLSPD